MRTDVMYPVIMAIKTDVEHLGVAEAKASLSQLIDRVARGERFVIDRRGRPVLGLVPPAEASIANASPAGLVSIVGALSDWAALSQVVEDIYAGRLNAEDRPVPDLG